MRPSASIVRAARSAAASQRAAAIAPIAPRALFAGLPSATNSAASSSTIRPFSSTVPVLKKASKAEKKGGKDSKASKKGQQEEEVEEALTEAEVKAIVDKARKKMEKSADWAKAAIYDGVERGRGRVMPALLDNIKVLMPDQGSVPLKSVASVTTRQNSLLVEVWDTSAMKHVESAIHKANLPGMSPQRDGNSLIRIPVARPTGEVRQAILKSLHETVEGAKNQVRASRQEGLKALGGRKEAGTDEVQKITDKIVHDMDEMYNTAVKQFAKA